MEWQINLLLGDDIRGSVLDLTYVTVSDTESCWIRTLEACLPSRELKVAPVLMILCGGPSSLAPTYVELPPVMLSLQGRCLFPPLRFFPAAGVFALVRLDMLIGNCCDGI